MVPAGDILNRATERVGVEGAVCPRASVFRGIHQLISKFLFKHY